MTEQIKKCKDCVNYDETKVRQCICYNNECEPNEDATHCCEFADRVNQIKSAIERCEMNLSELVDVRLKEAGINIVINTGPIFAPEVVIDTTKHDEAIRVDERAKTINEVIKAMCDDCKKEPCYGNECKHYKALRQMKGGAE